MRTPTLLFGALVVLGACAPDAPTSSPDDAEAWASQVQEAARELFHAMDAGDADRVLSFYRNDPSFVYLGCTEYILGGETFRQMVRPIYAREAPDSYEMGIVTLQVLAPEVVVVSVRGRSSRAQALFLTQIWHREGEAWTITMEHGSWPGCREPRAPHPYTSASDSAALRPDGPGN